MRNLPLQQGSMTETGRKEGNDTVCGWYQMKLVVIRQETCMEYERIKCRFYYTKGDGLCGMGKNSWVETVVKVLRIGL